MRCFGKAVVCRVPNVGKRNRSSRRTLSGKDLLCGINAEGLSTLLMIHLTRTRSWCGEVQGRQAWKNEYQLDSNERT